VPSSVPVTQNSSLTVKKVTWKTSFAAIAVSVPGSPVQGFVTGSENSVMLWACSVMVTVPRPPAAASAAPAANNATTVAKVAAPTRRLVIRSPLPPGPPPQEPQQAPFSQSLLD